MKENRPYFGKDGGKYKDFYEREAADRRYEQQQEILKETKRQNDLLEKQAQRERNGGLTDNEVYANDVINYMRHGGRAAPLILLFCLVIGVIGIFMGGTVLKLSICLYIIAAGFILEGLSSFRRKRKEGRKVGLYEISFIIIGILLIIITILPISTLKTFLPIANSNEYSLVKNVNDRITVNRMGIDGERLLYTQRKDNLDINETIQIEVEYYYKNEGKNNMHTTTITFNPQEYFRELESKNIDVLPQFYEVNVEDLIQ